jgi:hypothetical protein
MELESIKEILMRRDGMTSEEAEELIDEAREWIFLGADPSEVLEEEFGLEPDYIFDLI